MKMILPNKYEILKENPLIIGSYIISLLKEEDLSFLDIHLTLRIKKKLDLDFSLFLDTLTFLFLSNIIELGNNNIIRLTQ